MKPLQPIMLAGTGSDVGKSILATALCRIFLQDGYRPAPFKAQNMALNSFVTPDGLELGRAQAVQAEAAGIPCEADMNPLLLKPQNDHSSQVVLLGRPVGNRDACDYWQREGRERLSEEVHRAFDRLARRYNPVVLEGAGSITELNLRETDLVNMSMARYADARVILVADIDRGGVFASAYGSVMLQDEEDRKRIKGIIVNKFRGDLRLFDRGRQMLEEICGIPVLGVVPFLKEVHIDEEDSMDLKPCGQATTSPLSGGTLQVAVVRLPYISNFTDFNALERDGRLSLRYTDRTEDVVAADVIFLPGTKSTIADLHWLHRTGLAGAIRQARRAGKTLLGICGGYQMMGMEVLDPQHVESETERMAGLGFLPVTTVMTGEKRTRRVTGRLLAGSADCTLEGYEIHAGETRPCEADGMRPLLRLNTGETDGYYLDERCMGTYVHGILDNAAFVDFLLRPFAGRVGERQEAPDYRTYKQQQYDLLAAHVRRHLDMERLYEILTHD